MPFITGRCRLHQLLKERRKTNRWLSEVTGISEQKISNYANNVTTIGRMNAAKTIASALKCHIEDLYEWIEVD